MPLRTSSGRLFGWMGKVLGDHPDQRRELIDVARHFDVSPLWLSRVLERKPRALLKAVEYRG